MIAALLGAAVSVSASEYPIRPVEATLRLEPDRVVAELAADSIYWIEEVARASPMPASDWPADVRARVEAYALAHFRLSAGGRPLQGRLVEGRYRRLLWEVHEEGKFFLRLEFPAPPAGAELRVEADFYADQRVPGGSDHEGHGHAPHSEEYRTALCVPGLRGATHQLTPESPAATLDLAGAHRSAAAMAAEAAGRGASAALGASAAFPALVGAALVLGAEKRPRRSRVAGAALSAAAGLAAGLALQAPPWTPWAAALLAAAGASHFLGRGSDGAGALSLALVGAWWGAQAAPRLPHAWAAPPSALAGALAAGAALLGVFSLFAREQRLEAERLSERYAGEVYARRARLGATALAIAGGYGLWRSVGGG